GRISAAATKANIDAAITRIAQRAGPADRILILVIGHGSSDGQSSRINLPGPDLTAEELSGMLARFRTQPVVVVNATSASGAFLEPLAGRNRAIITATKSGMEQNETVFARFFVDAFAGDGADTDKDGKVSVLEAYDFANTEVERFYTSDNRLQTEHSMMGGDREVARAFVLGGGVATAAASSPEIRGLLEEKQALEGRVQALTARKSEMDEATYQRQLEQLLLELARKNREIREKEGTE
ncbi:MAG TPA: C13 family peptidase, partial [Longimicrobiaceae bacterium]